MLVFSLFLIVLSFPKFKGSQLTEKSFLRWVPPSSYEWRNAKIHPSVKLLWEHRWSKAHFQPGCGEDESLELIPIYFWPGDRVDLTCRLCRMIYLMNGRMKRWGYAADIDEFLLDPKQFVRVNELWKIVENTDEFKDRKAEKEDPELTGVIYLPDTRGSENDEDEKNYTKIVKDPPRYWQNDGKLTILNADVRSQGVYFCFDDDSRKDTAIFYILMAMIPPVKIPSDQPTLYTDNCGSNNGDDDSKIAPSHNWRFHFLPMGDFQPPPTCETSSVDGAGVNDDDGSCRRRYLEKRRWPSNIVDGCQVEKCRAKIVSPDMALDLFIELRWDDWTSCSNGQASRRREAHCYLIRGDRGSINIEGVNMWKKKAYFKWIRNLETVFDRKPFDTEGVRLFSSLLTSAMFDKPKIESCYSEKDDDDYLYELYDEIWRNVFLPTFGVPKDGDVDQLKNPFEACFRYGRMDDDEHVIGTFSTQVDYC